MFKPNREFQAGLNEDETRRRRQNNSLSLRRKDRENRLQKKRQRILNRQQNGSNNNQQSPPNNNNNNNSSPPQSPNNNKHQMNSNYGRDEQRVDLSRFVQGVFHTNPATQYECVKQFRIVLSKPSNPPIKQVIDSGCVPRFIQLCQDHSHPQLQYESLWTLLNIASGPAEAAAYSITNNAHICFMHLLKSSQFYEIKDQAMWALGNLAGDCTEIKNLLINNGLLSNVLYICQLQYDSKCNTNFNGNDDLNEVPLYMFISMLSTTSWCLSNLCRGSPPPKMQDLELILQCIIALMRHGVNFNKNKGQIFINTTGKFCNDKIENLIDEILSNLAWATSYLTGFENFKYEGANDYIIKRLGESGIIEQFVNLMDYTNKNVRHSCNRVIGNILTGSDENTKKCVDLGVLKKYYTVLTDYCSEPMMHHDTIHDLPQAKQSMNRERKEICWSISNIAAGPIDHKLAILDQGLFPVLCRFLAYGTNDVQREALWAISNASCDADKRIIDPLVNKFNVVECMSTYLGSHYIKSKTLLVAIECIQNILEIGNEHLCEGDDNPYLVKFEEDGLLQFLEEIQGDESLDDQIFEKAVEIVDKYWNGADSGHLDYNLNQGPNNDINQEMQNSYYRNNNNNNNNNSNNNTPQNNNNGHFNFGSSNFLNNNGNNNNNNNNNNNDTNNGGYQF